MDEVPVDGFLGGERGAVGLADDAGVVAASAGAEAFTDFGGDRALRPGEA